MKLEIPMADLRRILDVCHPIRDTDESRFTLNGVCFSNIDGKLVAVATDGRRLACVETKANLDEAANLSPTIVDMVKVNAKRTTLPKTAHNKMVSVTVADDKWTFAWKNYVIEGRVVQGRYPTWQQLIPKLADNKSYISADRKKMIEALGTAEPVLGLEFNFAEGERHARASRVLPEKNLIKVPMKNCTGSDSVLLDEEMLCEHLERLDDTSVEIRTYGPGKAIRVDSLQTVYLQMPRVRG